MQALFDYISRITENYGWNILIVGLAIFIVWKAFPLLVHQVEKNGLGPNALKALGIVMLLPMILVLGGGGMISGETLSALIGTIAGYIFGVDQSPNAPPRDT